MTNNINAISTLAQNMAKSPNKNMDAIDKIAKDFERMTLSQLLAYTDTDNDMSDSKFGGGAGERAFKPFLWDEYAKGFVDAGGIGIADAVKREILKLQEAANGGENGNISK